MPERRAVRPPARRTSIIRLTRPVTRPPLLLLALGAMLVLALGVALARGALGVGGREWPAPGGEWAMEGRAPSRSRALPAGPAPPLEKRYALELPDDTGEGSPVTVARGTLLVEARDRLRALDARTGRELWSFPLTGAFVSPASDGERVFVKAEASNKGHVYALDLRTGAQAWAFTPERFSRADTGYFGGHLTSPAVEGGTVYVGAGQELYALDAATGARRWTFRMADLVQSSAAVDAARAYIADNRAVYAVDRRTGVLAWKRPTARTTYFSPVVADGAVYVRDGRRLLALGAERGELRWKAAGEGQGVQPAAARAGRLYASTGQALLAYDARTGRRLWAHRERNYVALPVVAGAWVWTLAGATGQMRLLALDAATGKVGWEERMPDLAVAAPVLAGRMLYVRTTGGEIIGLTDRDGE